MCVVVKEGVKTIYSDVFEEISDNIVEVELPDGLEKIVDSAFYGCENLEKINIPSTVTEIEDYAFSGCNKLTSVTLPYGLKELGDGAFQNSTSITWKGQTYQTYSKFCKTFYRQTKNPVTLKQVSGFKVTIERTDGGVKAEWKKVKNATKYELLYANNKDLKNAKKIKTKNNYEYPELKNNSTYYFKVRALNDKDSSYMEIVYGDYSKTIKKVLKVSEYNKVVMKHFKNILKKSKNKSCYFKIADIDGDGIKELFIGKKANKADKIYFVDNGYGLKPSAVPYNWEDIKRYCSKMMVDFKNHRIVGYLKNSKVIGIEVGGGNEGGTDWVVPGKHYFVCQYKNKGAKALQIRYDNNDNYAKYKKQNIYVDGKYCISKYEEGRIDQIKKISKGKYKTSVSKLKFKTKKFMVKNNAKNRAKYCK